MHGCVTLAEKEKDVRCGRTREKPRIVYKLGPGKDDMRSNNIQKERFCPYYLSLFFESLNTWFWAAGYLYIGYGTAEVFDFLSLAISQERNVRKERRSHFGISPGDGKKEEEGEQH